MSPSKQKSFFSEEVAKVNLDNIIHHPLFFTKNSKLQKLEIRLERERVDEDRDSCLCFQ